MTTVTDGLYQFGGMPVGPALMGVGNVYYVCQTANTVVHADMVQRFGGQKYKNDHSNILHNTIQSALAAVVDRRNDYVIVGPDSTYYGEVGTLAVSKNNVHILCPAGLGPDVGCMRAASVTPTTALHAFTITGRATELAGFWIRGETNKHCVHVSASTAQGSYIHHNDMAMNGAGTLGCGVVLAGDVAGCRIENNFFFDSTDGGTIPGIISCGVGCGRTIIRNNMAIIVGTTVTKAINLSANEAWCWVDGNVICESAAGAGAGGSIALGISTGASTMVTRNLIGITTTANAVIGGQANEAYVENYLSTSGGKLAI